jgi:transketolase
VKLLPELDRAGLNVKIVAVVSPQLFRRQDTAYREAVASTADRWDAMCVTNRSLRLMGEWLTHPLVREYSLASDWDDRWRTGGTVDEVIEEAHLDAKHILAGIERFVRERGERLRRLREAVAAFEQAG